MVRRTGGRAILVPVTEPVEAPTPVSPATTPAAATARRRRPFGLWVVAALRFAHAAQLALIGLGIGNIGLRTIPYAEVTDGTILRTIYLVSAVAIAVGILGLLAMRRWGWVVTVLFVGVGLSFELIQAYRGRPDDLALLTLVISAFYLNQRSVRALAGRSLPSDPAERHPVEVT
jgi:hypothetical protein